MKRIIPLLLSFICLLTAKAQSVDERVGAMMTSSDWLELERKLPTLKDSIKWPSIRLMAEALVAANFNRDDEAVSLIDTLLSKHQAEIGFESTMNLIILQSMIESRRGNYAKAADIIGNFISQVKTHAPQTDISAAENIYKHMYAKRNLKPTSLTRPAGDITINATIKQDSTIIERFYPSAKDDTTRRTYSLCIPVEINGKRYDALLDTGSSTTYCSMNFARKVGAHISPDTTSALGVKRVDSFIGMIDSINIGPMTLHNAETTIVDGDLVTDSLLIMADFVIGLDFLTLCGEAQFYPNEGKIIFPERLTPLPPTGHNIYRNESNSIMLEAYVNGERCKFIFDTGHVSNINLSKSYYDKHKHKLNKIGKKTEGYLGGVGYVGQCSYLNIPNVTLTIGGTDITMNNAKANIDSTSPFTPFDGNVGIGLIQSCRKTTLNLRDLFLKIEN